MVQIAFLLWALFFIILGFSMMPKCMTLVMVVSFIGGFLDGIYKNKQKKKKNKNRRLKMTLDNDAWNF
jgi:hypothetical protein